MPAHYSVSWTISYAPAVFTRNGRNLILKLLYKRGRRIYYYRAGLLWVTRLSRHPPNPRQPTSHGFSGQLIRYVINHAFPFFVKNQSY